MNQIHIVYERYENSRHEEIAYILDDLKKAETTRDNLSKEYTDNSYRIETRYIHSEAWSK